jgi:hypothetical protein
MPSYAKQKLVVFPHFLHPPLLLLVLLVACHALSAVVVHVTNLARSSLFQLTALTTTTPRKNCLEKKANGYST